MDVLYPPPDHASRLPTYHGRQRVVRECGTVFCARERAPDLLDSYLPLSLAASEFTAQIHSKMHLHRRNLVSGSSGSTVLAFQGSCRYLFRQR